MMGKSSSNKRAWGVARSDSLEPQADNTTCITADQLVGTHTHTIQTCVHVHTHMWGIMYMYISTYGVHIHSTHQPFTVHNYTHASIAHIHVSSDAQSGVA